MKNSLFALVSALLFLSLIPDDPPFYSHQISSGYQTLYPSAEKLFYHKISVEEKTDPDSTSLTFYFINTFTNFSHYEFRQDKRQPVNTGEGKFAVKFSRLLKEDSYSTLKIKVFSKDQKAEYFEMQMTYDPKYVQQQSGRNVEKDGFFVRKSDVGFLEIPFENFIPASPSEQEKKSLRDQFGSAINNAASEKEKILHLSEAVIRLVEPYRGIPGNDMDTLTAAEQLMELKLHNKKVYCGNIAEIFIGACLAFDIPVRKIGLGYTYDSNTDPAIYHSDYHTTVEVFSKETRSWFLVDLSFYFFEVTMDGNALNFIDFWHFLNAPSYREKMVISEFDIRQQKIVSRKINESQKLNGLLDYYKLNQKFCFAHRNGYFSY